jgi:hypothetical protein
MQGPGIFPVVVVERLSHQVGKVVTARVAAAPIEECRVGLKFSIGTHAGL